MVDHLLYKPLHVLETTSGRIIECGECTRGVKAKKGKIREALWTPNFIGKCYRPKGMLQGGHHASPSLHWRRGHKRNQRYGEGNKLVKKIWIEPMLIGELHFKCNQLNR